MLHACFVRLVYVDVYCCRSVHAPHAAQDFLSMLKIFSKLGVSRGVCHIVGISSTPVTGGLNTL